MLKEAFALHTQGKLAEAERAYGELLRREPKNFQALHLMGVLALQRGDKERAIALIGQSLALEPRQPLAHRDLGNALQQASRLEAAIASHDKALALKPDLAETWNNRGIALAGLERWSEALESYGRAIALKPDFAQAYNNRGTVLVNLKRFADAAVDFDHAIKLNPGYVMAFNNRGGALNSQGLYAEALADFDRAIALAPDEAEAHVRRGGALIGLRLHEEALKSYDRAIALDPADADAHDGRGSALHLLFRPQEALESSERALALNPNSANYHNNRGSALAALNRANEALEAHERVLALDPTSPIAHNNHGTALDRTHNPDAAMAAFDHALSLDPNLAQIHVNRGNIFNNELKRYDEALACFNRGIELAPYLADAHFGRAMTLLANGRFAEGWPPYEWRLKRVPPDTFHPQGRPVWTGKEDLRGKTIFVEVEQALGDMIQFFRFAPLLADLGARVILSVRDQQMRLIEGQDPRLTIVPEKIPPAEFDYYIALMSLPMAFGVTPQSIPAKTPYLRAEPDRVEAWRKKIGPDGFKIGVVWQSGPNNIARSFPPALLAGIAAKPGVRLIALQKDIAADNLAGLGMTLETLGADFDAGPQAFLDSAAALQSLDLVITSDTSMAHLAGALARPTWVALKYAADWRWLVDREDSPWYPGMRLFRQRQRNDWQSVFDAMGEALDQMRKKSP